MIGGGGGGVSTRFHLFPLDSGFSTYVFLRNNTVVEVFNTEMKLFLNSLSRNYDRTTDYHLQGVVIIRASCLSSFPHFLKYLCKSGHKLKNKGHNIEKNSDMGMLIVPTLQQMGSHCYYD